jgi:hypothetical protein
LYAKLPELTADVSPWNHWRVPVIGNVGVGDFEQGPVLVTVEYRVDPQHVKAFLRAMVGYERIRRRDGASRWGIYRDLERGDVYVETFIVSSWAEHLRQHERVTREDRKVEDRVRGLARAEPTVRHLIHADAE